jgi:hypothetical protein
MEIERECFIILVKVAIVAIVVGLRAGQQCLRTRCLVRSLTPGVRSHAMPGVSRTVVGVMAEPIAPEAFDE